MAGKDDKSEPVLDPKGGEQLLRRMLKTPPKPLAETKKGKLSKGPKGPAPTRV